jgi:Type VI secretion system/phage-baseplate injector OB domain
MIYLVVSGYSGTYRGVVVDDDDPIQQRRLHVVVPDVHGDTPVWALASVPAGASGPFPTVGDVVQISFERGDSDYPVWEVGEATGSPEKYRGIVVDNDDPLQAHRLQVIVPDVDPSPAWAAAPGGDVQSPDVGAAVWIVYDNGDPGHPRWVGLA